MKKTFEVSLAVVLAHFDHLHSSYSTMKEAAKFIIDFNDFELFQHIIVVRPDRELDYDVRKKFMDAMLELAKTKKDHKIVLEFAQKYFYDEIIKTCQIGAGTFKPRGLIFRPGLYTGEVRDPH